MTTQHSPTDGSTSTMRRTLLIGGGIAAALLLAFLAWSLLRGAPEEVSIDAAVGAVDDGEADAGDANAATDRETDPQGTWTVTTDAVPFSFDESTGTFLGFRIDEELARVGTDDRRRDNRTRGALKTSEFPLATFTLTEPIELADHDVDKPSSMVVVGIADDATVEVQLYLVHV